MILTTGLRALRCVSAIVSFGILLHTAAFSAVVSVSDEGDRVLLATEALDVQVQRDPWRISVLDKQGGVLLREAAGQALQYGAHRPTRVNSFVALGQITLVRRDPPLYHAEDESVIVGEAVRFVCATTDGATTMAVHVAFRNAHVFSVWATVAGDVQDTAEVFESSAGEHFSASANAGTRRSWTSRACWLRWPIAPARPIRAATSRSTSARAATACSSTTTLKSISTSASTLKNNAGSSEGIRNAPLASVRVIFAQSA